MSIHEYWNNYNPDNDIQGLTQINREGQSATGGTLKTNSAGYDPLWIYSQYGDRLKLLPRDLQDSVYEAMKGGTTDPMLRIYLNQYSGGATLNQTWTESAKPYLPGLE